MTPPSFPVRQMDGRPKPGTRREYEVSPGAIATSGYTRDGPEDDGVSTGARPGRAFYRCYELIVRNTSTATLTITSGGHTMTVPGKTTDRLSPNGEDSDLDAYTITPSAATASGAVRVVEKCVAWEGKLA